MLKKIELNIFFLFLFFGILTVFISIFKIMESKWINFFVGIIGVFLLILAWFWKKMEELEI